MTTQQIDATPTAGEEAVVASGGFIGAGNVAHITLGFAPRWVRLMNETDSIIWERFDGMAASHTIKSVLAGGTGSDATAIDTTTAISFNQQGFILSAALAASGKSLSWVAVHKLVR